MTKYEDTQRKRKGEKILSEKNNKQIFLSFFYLDSSSLVLDQLLQQPLEGARGVTCSLKEERKERKGKERKERKEKKRKEKKRKKRKEKEKKKKRKRKRKEKEKKKKRNRNERKKRGR